MTENEDGYVTDEYGVVLCTVQDLEDNEGDKYHG